MIYFFNFLQTIFAGLLGSFRGGAIVSTGMTQLTRAIFSFGMASMMMLHGWAFLCCLALGVAIHLSLLVFSHAPFQNMRDWKEELCMFGIGCGRGLMYATAICYWFNPVVFILIPIFGALLWASYKLGYATPFNINIDAINLHLTKGTTTAEFITGVLYFLSFLAVNA